MNLPTQPQAYTVRCTSLIHYEKGRIQQPVVKEEFSGKGKRKMPLLLKSSLNLCPRPSRPLFVCAAGWNHVYPQSPTRSLAIEFHRGSEW